MFWEILLQTTKKDLTSASYFGGPTDRFPDPSW